MKKYSSLVLSAALAVFASVPARALNVSIAPGASIQSAIDQVASSGGGTVNLASGVYNVNATIKLKSNVTIAGAGNPATTLAAQGAYNVFEQNAEGLSNITIRNLKIVGKPDANCFGILVQALTNYHSNINLTNVQVQECGMGVHLKRINGGRIDTCNIHNNGAYAGTLGFQNLYIRESKSYTVIGSTMNNCTTSSGLHLGGACDSILVRWCGMSSNYQYGLNITDSMTHITIDGNTASSNKEYGFVAWAGSGSIINNRAPSNPSGGYLIYGAYTQSNNL